MNSQSCESLLWGDVILRLVDLDFRSLELATEPPRTATCACSLIDWQRLNGLAVGDGIDWVSRNICSRSATSVLRCLPSADIIFNWWQFVTVSFPSAKSLCFSLFQYFLAVRWSLLSVSTFTMSTMEKYHFSCTSSQTVLIYLSSKLANILWFCHCTCYGIVLNQNSFGNPRSYHFLLPPVISSKTITISAIKTINPNMYVCYL